jgi:hypothetical protein
MQPKAKIPSAVSYELFQSRRNGMADDKQSEDLVRIFRDPSDKERFIVEVLGEPVKALKQMKAEPWKLREAAENPPADKS